MSKILRDINVLDAARERLRYLYSEFDEVIVAFSGGKDSTACLHLCIEMAKSLNRLPVKIFFIDQEAEWQATIDYTRLVMSMPEVTPLWLQIPIRLFNATSYQEPWLYCWEPGKKWMREKESCAITENIYGTDRFYDLFKAFLCKTFPHSKVALIGGVRCQESPTRRLSMCNSFKYPVEDPWISWAKKHSPSHLTFYPLYDWDLSDVWHYIESNGFPYNKLYDYQYQYGKRLNQMRCSNLHHETAISSLFMLQEIEPETWNKLCARLGGVNAFGHIGEDVATSNSIRDELPPMFSNWEEYIFYLVENLVADEFKPKMVKKFKLLLDRYEKMTPNGKKKLYRVLLNTVLCNDFSFSKIKNWEAKASVNVYRDWLKTGIIQDKDLMYAQDTPRSLGQTPSISCPVDWGNSITSK